MTYGIGIPEHDQEGRVITAEFADYYVVTCYTPNSQDGLKRLDYRMEWENVFLAYLKKLEETKPVIFCGDLNVAHRENDLKNPKTKPQKRRLHRRGERKVYRSSGCGIYRYIPLFLPGRGGNLFLVVLPL